MISFRTQSGKRIDLSRPRVEDIDIRDIARGLARICRFSGQILWFYSVAQHACLVALLVPARLRWAALNHDNTEAYLGDVSRHLKHSVFLDGYRGLEQVWTAVMERAMHLTDLTPNDRRIIKAADDLAAVYEHVVFRLQQPWDIKWIDWALQEGFVGSSSREDLLTRALDLPENFVPWTYQDAEDVFLLKWDALKPGKDQL